jgi:Fe-S-cluster-containing hydrogenase component 2
MSYLKDGILELNEILLPDAIRLQHGRVAIIECVQHIPCNPCVDICPRHAITIAGNITNPPVIDFEKCNGCGLCVANCPGLAIFTVDETAAPDLAEIGIPYEFRPLPQVGHVVAALDRAGRVVCDAEVRRVLNPKAYDRTPVVFLLVPKKYSMIARFFTFK